MGSISKLSKIEKGSLKKPADRRPAAKPSSAPAKITSPRPAENIYLRKRLFKTLDKARKKPVIWLAAPAGAGKTTLIASYLQTRRLPCLWYQIDEGDGDIASFFHYMGIAAKKAAPRHKKPLPHLTPEYLLGLPTFTRNYFRELFSRLNHSSSKNNPPVSPFKKGGIISSVPSFAKGGLGRIKKGGFVIVLDNYQDAPADSQLHNIIQTGLSEIPDGINVIIISRNQPPAQLTRLEISEQLAMLGWDDLRLTEEESSGIARLKGVKKKLSQETLQAIYKHTQGWAAGIVLMLERQMSEEFLHKSITGFAPQAMFDYFASEIFNRLDKPSQEILLKTAFMPIMTARFAEQLTDSAHAGHLLADLNRRNYFIAKKPLPEPVYQYHPLFHEFLLAQARQQLSPLEIVQVQRKTAEILESRGQFEDAIILYRNAEDWVSMARLILLQAKAMIAEGRNKTLEEWISHIPQAVIDEIPWLLYWLGVCHMPFELSEGRGYFEAAFEKFKLQNDAAGIFLAWAGAVDAFIYQLGDFKPLDRWIAEIETLLAKHPTLPSPEIEAKITAGLFIALMYRQPQHPDMPVWAERLQRLIEVSPDASLSMLMGNHLLLYYTLWSGDLAKATNLVNILEPLSRLPNLAPLLCLTWHAIKSMHCTITADNATCIQTVEDGLKIAEATGVHLWDFMLLTQGAWGRLSSGDIAGAHSQLERMLSVMDNSRLVDVAHYQLQAFAVAMHRNDVSLMVEHAEAALRLIRETGMIWGEGLALSAVAIAYIVSGKQDAVAKIIEQARQIAQAFRSKTIEAYVLQAEVEFAMEQKNETACLQALQNFFTFLKQQGFVYGIFWRPNVMSRLCAIALEHNIEPDYVKFLIKKRGILPPDDAVSLDNWPYPLKVYTLGRFSLLCNDKPLQSSKKAQKKPLEMLKAIISLGGREVKEEEITDLLWPDAEGDSGHKSFEITLIRLRRLIGNDKAIRLKEGVVSLDYKCCFVDVWKFERLIGKADALWNENKQTEAVQIYEKAINIYKGDFLKEDIRRPYTLSMRERLKGKFSRSLIRTGRYYEDAGSIKKAVELYQKGIEVDNLCEEIYQQLMLCYQRLGLKAEAIAAYHRCHNTMTALLNTEPSAKTKEIYQKIVDCGL